MARPKGTPKTGGRKKGTPNKSTAEMRDLVQRLLEKGLEHLENNKDNADADWLAIVKTTLPFVLSKKTENTISFDEKTMQAMKDSIDKVNSLFD
ncbi:MAG: hypothetical protein WC914_00125 [Proteiniphilum sp.]